MMQAIAIVVMLIGQAPTSASDQFIKKPKGAMSYSTLLLINEKHEVLLLRRIGTSFANGMYSLPGGKIESGETAVAAAIREAREEVGISIDMLEFVHVVDRQGTETEFYIFTFKPITWQGEPCNSETDKCDDIAWFAVDKLPENMIAAHRQAIELSQQGIMYSQHGWDSGPGLIAKH